MSGWGNKDDKTSAGTVAITTAGVVTGTSTNFDPELNVGDYLKAGTQEFICTARTSDTAAEVVKADGGTITAVSAGTNFTINEKPKFVSVYADGGTIATTDVYGVDEDEAAAAAGDGKGIAHAGWVHAKTVASGRITAIDTVGAADTDRAEGSYILDPSMYSTASSGDGARFKIDVASNGAATVTVLNPGSGFADNEVITVTDAQLGGGGAANLTFAVNGIESRKQYETLVAMSGTEAATMGDAEDTEFPDS
jgi:hypothetical protein